MQAFGILRGTVTFVVDVLLILTLTFFFVTDVERIRAGFIRLVPRKARPEVDEFITEADFVIAGFVRGQVILALIVGIAAVLILAVMRIPYALLLGVAAGVASLIPILGEFIGGVPMFVRAHLCRTDTSAHSARPLHTRVEAQGRVLAPIIVGKSVGDSALVIFVAIVIGGRRSEFLAWC